ncbi:SIR2 family protein [Phaeovulum sp. NW3]|uniref:SIR2 family protein n=1 Tax=Phaeovulum sp. NW3 TaxID=2934933 RepID=UPI00201FDF45|nr:SIR2 family protein [Phaeovulum sp. NW3]MCL7464515.1 SIR2 family protein [Phaeovulum sp. NW3]
MSYWVDQPSSTNNLRLFQSDGTWLAWNEIDEDGKTRRGAREQVEERLLSALNATNLVALLGSGASFAAKNAGGKQAPGMADLWDDARQKVGKADFDKVVAEVWGTTDKKDIEALLSLCKMTVELQAARGAAAGKNPTEENQLDLPSFVHKAEQAILDRVDFVSEQTDLISHKEFLRRLARRSAEKARVKLFTTNYDRCIEEAAVARNLALIDGFSHSAIQRFNRDHFQQDIVRRSASSTRADYVDGVFHLYKLHGSMDWRRRKSDGVVIRRLDHDENHEPVLIYPRSSKYQEAFAPPYLDMFAAWQAALREPDTTLIVSGFGFADDHISAPIWSALESNLSIRLVLCDPCFVPVDALDVSLVDTQEHAISQTNDNLRTYQNRILSLVREGDSRITVLNGRFSDLALALPEIVGETDRQRLEARLERIRGQDHDNR